MYIRRGVPVLSILGVLLMPASAVAQAVGVGPRMSFVSVEPSDPAAGDAAGRDRYTGGTLRLALSHKTALEIAADWRSTTNEDATLRVRDYPVQGSLLVYPWRGALAPYVLGGVGWYWQKLEAMADGEVLAEQTERRFGYHGGFGGELQLGRRASLFLDYRYRFIQFGEDAGPADAGEGEQGAGALGLPGVGSLFDAFQMSHEGSMWTGGVVIKF